MTSLPRRGGSRSGREKRGDGDHLTLTTTLTLTLTLTLSLTLSPPPNPNLEEAEAEAAEAGGGISEVARAQVTRRVQVALHLVGVRDQSGARARGRRGPS